MRLIADKFLILFLLLTLLGLACHSSQSDGSEDKADRDSDAVASLLKEVINIHDEVMPEMGKIQKLATDLEKFLETTEEDTDAKQIHDIIRKLEDANEGMMTWMKEFEPPKSDQEQAVVLEYLNGEKEKVTKVKQDMLGSKEEAEKFLKELSANKGN
ncbi:MAG: hypothetical protein AAF587_42215 [Bacteroidota bacterium]